MSPSMTMLKSRDSTIEKLMKERDSRSREIATARTDLRSIAAIVGSPNTSASNDKYEIVRDDCTVVAGERVYKIRAIKTFIINQGTDHETIVHQGDNGGYIKGEHNLSPEGNSWVFPGSAVVGSARLSEDMIFRASYEPVEVVAKAMGVSSTNGFERIRRLFTYTLGGSGELPKGRVEKVLHHSADVIAVFRQ